MSSPNLIPDPVYVEPDTDKVVLALNPHDDESTVRLTPERARKLADALHSAADHAERFRLNFDGIDTGPYPGC